jgi:hypothetical protein
MTNTNTARETAILCSMYRAEMPRTVTLAEQGHPMALRSLELRALADEVADQAAAACVAARNAGWGWVALHTVALRRSERAKSDRARAILRSMARIANQATDAAGLD